MNDAVLVAIIAAIPGAIAALVGMRNSKSAEIIHAKVDTVSKQIDGRMDQMLKLQQEAGERREKSRDDERAAERATIHAAEIAAAREAGRGERK